METLKTFNQHVIDESIVSRFTSWCDYMHDVHANQKYADILPYSFHLSCVEAQVIHFSKPCGLSPYQLSVARCVARGHDLIEDARVSYNNIVDKTESFTPETSLAIADGIYGCTESTGKNRKERHDAAYISRLTSNDMSVYVKLCDIRANILFSQLTNSSMFAKYKKEWVDMRVILEPYNDRFRPLFDVIDDVTGINNQII